jgi:hypothetical protein
LVVGWVRSAFEEGRRFQNHAALAKTALGDIFFKPRFLARMGVVFRESFDGGEGLPGGILALDLAGANRLIALQNGTGTAHPKAAAKLGSSQSQIIAKYPQKRHFRFNRNRYFLLIDRQFVIWHIWSAAARRSFGVLRLDAAFGF